MWKFTRKKLGRSVDDPDRNQVRGHALFVRFMERKGLADCLRGHFPETMTLGQLRRTTPRELMNKYGIVDRRMRDRVMRIVEESRREDLAASDVEVSLKTTVYL